MQKNILLTIATLLLFIVVQVSYAQDITPRWKIVKLIEDNIGAALTPTSDGNVYRYDGYKLIKYNTNGDELWSKKMTNSYANISYVKTTNDQFCIAASHWTTYFEIDTFVFKYPRNQDFTIIYRIDSSGSVLWLKHFKGESYNAGNSLSMDIDGNFYFFGQFKDSISIDGVTITGKPATIKGLTNICLAKFSSTGDLIWLKNIGNANKKITASSIITDKNNNMYIAGTYGTDTLTVLPYTLIEPVKKDEDVFLAKIDTTGNTQWVKHFPDEVIYLTDASPRLQLDNDGNVLMYWTDNRASGYMGKGYILKYHPNGEILKKVKLYKPASSVSNYRIAALEVDSQNNIYMAAEFSDVLTPIPAAPKIILSVSRRDVVFLKYDSAFNLKWYKHIINKWENYCFGFAIFNNKEIYLFGEGYGYIVNQVPQNISFGGEYEFYFSNSKSKLSYLARIETCNPIEENLVKNNAVLEAPQAWGNWQWYVDSTKIEGATWYSYAPKKSGTYTVLSKDGNSCYRLSNPYVWIMTGTDENFVGNNVNIYPNPTLNKQFTLQIPDKVNSISIYSIEGSLYKNIAVNQDGNYEIEINQSGIYFVRIDTPQGLIVKKIIVQ